MSWFTRNNPHIITCPCYCFMDFYMKEIYNPHVFEKMLSLIQPSKQATNQGDPCFFHFGCINPFAAWKWCKSTQQLPHGPPLLRKSSFAGLFVTGNDTLHQLIWRNIPIIYRVSIHVRWWFAGFLVSFFVAFVVCVFFCWFDSNQSGIFEGEVGV